MDFIAQLRDSNLDREFVSQLVAKIEQGEQKAHELKALTERVERDAAYIKAANTKIAALTLELAHHKRIRFAYKSEAFSAQQRELFEESWNADLAALETEVAQLQKPLASQSKKASRPTGRKPLPEHLPRIEHRHEPASCTCAACGGNLIKIGEDVSDQLDVEPARFFVHRHIRPQYACRACETVTAEPVPPAMIDGSLAAPGLHAWVVTQKFLDHLPLYRIEQISERQGVGIARSTLAEWVGRIGVALAPLCERLADLLRQRTILHADETPVPQLDPGRGKTKRAYLWAYRSNDLDGQHDPPIIVFDYQASRAGNHAQHFLRQWRGHLMVDDYSGYKQLFQHGTITELGCMAHARRKFFDLHAANGNPVAAQALTRIGELYAIERAGKSLDTEARYELRQREAQPKLNKLRDWLRATRATVADGGALAKAIDYSLKRWPVITRYAYSGDLPIGRVEKWRGGGRLGLSVDRAFRLRCPSNSAVTPFPLPAHRTGRAAFPHPALFQRIRPSRSASQRGAATNGSVPTARRETDRDIGGIPFRVCHVVASTRFVDGARHNRRSGDRFALLGLG